MQSSFKTTLLVFLGTVGLSASATSETLPPKILKVSPDSVYANATDYAFPVYKTQVFGENFAVEDQNLKIYLDGREATVVWGEPPKKSPSPAPGTNKTTPAATPKGAQPATGSDSNKTTQALTNKGADVYAIRETGSSRVVLMINKRSFRGTVQLSVATAEGDPPIVTKSDAISLVLAKRDYGSLFQVWALLISIVILAIPILLVKSTGSYHVPNKPNWIVGALFLDKETATYSLSKFQFYLWTAVSVFGYVYLFGSRYFIQGISEFIEIPKNLPGIVLISAATGAAAQFVTTQRGPKGAGEEHPAYADFVSSGGIVVAERFQFFVWTVMGALAFLYLTISQDPARISALPTVPDGFLQLMGISSLGYLAGKLARRPGPVIDDVKMETKGVPDLTLITLRGRILSPNATFKITYKPERADKKKEQNITSLLTSTPEIKDKDEQSKPDDTAKTLVITVTAKCDDLLKDASKFTISNPDGQSASWSLDQSTEDQPAEPPAEAPAEANPTVTESAPAVVAEN
jgi:hypothetical protein